MHPTTLRLGVAVSVLAVLALTAPAHAVDGVVLINQTVALTGGASPGDSPGFPVTLSRPGSYRFSGNLTLPSAATTAISITADDVTLDLNGFAIIGTPVCLAPIGGSCPGDGVHAAAGVDNVTVMNGTITGMGRHGIQLLGVGNRVERVHARQNAGSGILAGIAAVVTGNRLISNGANGIGVGTGSVVKDNTARNNGENGIGAGAATHLSGNTASFNEEAGIVASTGSVVIGNTAVSNGSFGLLFTGSAGSGYAQNVLTNNNGGSANPQVSGGLDRGHNVCGTDIICP